MLLYECSPAAIPDRQYKPVIFKGDSLYFAEDWSTLMSSISYQTSDQTVPLSYGITSNSMTRVFPAFAAALAALNVYEPDLVRHVLRSQPG